jgi:LysM repeat protein
VAAVIAVAVTIPGRSSHPRGASTAQKVRRLPPYWTVRPGDTFSLISTKTGLTIAQLQAFNPDTDPGSIVPGQRLKLWAHYPQPRPKPPGPMFWTVRPGDSFGSIAAKTKINIVKLEELNPQLRPPTILQPGDRIRLRR